MFSGSVALNNGVLDVTGDPTVGSNIQVNLTADGTGITGNAGSGPIKTYSLSSVTGVSITGGSGNDIIYVDTGVTLPTDDHQRQR